MYSTEYLRHRAAVYLRDAGRARDVERRNRLIMLAARCQEMMAEIEHRAFDGERRGE